MRLQILFERSMAPCPLVCLLRMQDDKRHRALAPLGVRTCDYGDLQHVWVRSKFWSRRGAKQCPSAQGHSTAQHDLTPEGQGTCVGPLRAAADKHRDTNLVRSPSSRRSRRQR